MRPAKVEFVLGLRLGSPLNGSFGWSRRAAFWRARLRREQRDAARIGTELHARRVLGPAVSAPIVVTITRIAPRELDDDNLAAACKSVRDGIADGFRTDDRNPLITWRYAQRRGKPREYAVSVAIESGF